MTKGQARAALGCALVGLGASVWAAYVHYQLLYDPHYSSFCDITATVSCSTVYQSRFSTFQGIPVAIFGAIWFGVAALLAIAAIASREELRRSVPGYLLVLSMPALAVILYLGYASFFLIKAVCVLCLTTYAAVIAVLVISAVAMAEPLAMLPSRLSRDVRVFFGSPLAVTVFLLFGISTGTIMALFPRGPVTEAVESTAQASSDVTAEFQRWYSSQPRHSVPVAADGAKVLIVKFNDYQCPGCSESYQQFKPILAKFAAARPNEVRMVLKDFPLGADCNAAVARTVHPAACDAAVAVRLARQHGRGEALEEWLYTHQPEMNRASIRAAAHDIGQVDDFDARYEAVLQLVKADITLGRELEVRGTPTFFINGVKIESTLAPLYLDAAINYELGGTDNSVAVH